MNDFLKKIRQSQKQSRQRQSGVTRKSYDTHNSPLKERRKIIDRRTQMAQIETDTETLSEFIKEAIPMIRENLAQIASSMERMADIKEIMSKEKIKEHREIGNFFENLNTILVQKIIPSMDKYTESDNEKSQTKKAFSSFGLDGNNTKEDVLAIIREMRQKGSTFAAIADYLKEQGIPTFSGRGEWHAQTIHRLYK